MTDDQHPGRPAADAAGDRPPTHGDPGMPAAGRRPADRDQPPPAPDFPAPSASDSSESPVLPPAAAESPVRPSAATDTGASPVASGAQTPPPAARDAEPPLDPHAPLSADGPTIRLSKAALVPPGDSAATRVGDVGPAGREPAERPGTGADEPTLFSPPAARDDEATTLLTPPPAPAASDDRPAAQLADPEHESSAGPGRTDAPGDHRIDEPTGPASRDGGSTMRLQPPFFAPGTTRTPRARPVTGARDEPAAGPFDEAVESRERWGSSPAIPDSWMDSPARPDERTAGRDDGAGTARDTPGRWQDDVARAAAAADEQAARGTPERDTFRGPAENTFREPTGDTLRQPIGDGIRVSGADAAGSSTGPDSGDPRPAGDRTDDPRSGDPRRGGDLTGVTQLGDPRPGGDPAGATGPGDRGDTAGAGRGPDPDGSRPAGSDGPGARSGAPAGSPDPVTDRGDGADGVPEEVAAGRRLSSAGALIWVLLALLGFTLVVQLQSNDDDAGLATARQEDLVGILSDLEARDQRLQQEINALEESQRQLTSGVAGRQAALAEAGKRADELGLLSGTLPARGPGLKITIDPKGAPIKASAILNAVQELRGAGGEVMEIIGDNGVAVRIVASSYFVDADGGQVIVDGKQLSGPYTVWVIGVPATMQTALQIPGGVVASVSQAGGNVTMEQRTTVEVTAVRQPTSLQYARPVS